MYILHIRSVKIFSWYLKFRYCEYYRKYYKIINLYDNTVFQVVLGPYSEWQEKNTNWTMSNIEDINLLEKKHQSRTNGTSYVGQWFLMTKKRLID